jgi:hypothetical protein
MHDEQSRMDRTDDDRAQILQHIHSIFQAYIDQDRDKIRALHTPDWVGFQNPSTQIERGMDAYMINAGKGPPVGWPFS